MSSTQTKFKPELAATVLIEAAYTTDEKAAEKFGVSIRSLPNWRNKLESDQAFATIFHYKKEQFEAGWAQDLPIAIKAAIEFLKRSAQEADHKKPDVIYSIAGGLKILADIQTTKDLLDARLAELSGSKTTQDRSMVAATEGNA